jgi:hypothetical protein
MTPRRVDKAFRRPRWQDSDKKYADPKEYHTASTIKVASVSRDRRARQNWLSAVVDTQSFLDRLSKEGPHPAAVRGRVRHVSRVIDLTLGGRAGYGSIERAAPIPSM